MANEYIVCRLCPVVQDFVGRVGADMSYSDFKNCVFHAPILDENAQVFSTKAKADAHCKKMNEELRNPKVEYDKNGVGHSYIDASPYTDYRVLPIRKGN